MSLFYDNPVLHRFILFFYQKNAFYYIMSNYGQSKKNKNNLEINYCDNGAGAPLEKKICGNGLQNVRNRILDVKGNITFESEPNKGFKPSIVLPF